MKTQLPNDGIRLFAGSMPIQQALARSGARKAASPSIDKFTQRKIKISSQGLFFNNKELEKKSTRLGQQRVNFFTPFNSAFERDVHTKNKQRKNFNHNGLLHTTDIQTMSNLPRQRSKGSSSYQDIQRARRPQNFLSELESGNVIAGKRALDKVKQLQNKGSMKRALNGYIKNEVTSSNALAYNKTNFVPFVDERNHLGQLIDSEVRTELGGQSYIKKLVIFKPGKSNDKIEIREDIPRRWLEQVGYSENGSPRRVPAGSPLGGTSAPSSAIPQRRLAALSDGFQLQAHVNGQLQSPSYGQPDSADAYSSFDKRSKNYKSLVAAARNMKLPDEKSNTGDNQTQIDTQASEQNFNKTSTAQNYQLGFTAALTDMGGAASAVPPEEQHLIKQFSNKPKTQQVLRRNLRAKVDDGIEPDGAGDNKVISERGHKQDTFFSAPAGQESVGVPESVVANADSRNRGATAGSAPATQAGILVPSMHQPARSEYQPPQAINEYLMSTSNQFSMTQQQHDVTGLLTTSKQIINLKYDHLRPEKTAIDTMKKLGMKSGSKQAIENGITTKTENMLGGTTSMTNPQIRLSKIEEDYVLSQLVQKNFEIRRGQSIFQSKTKRSRINGFQDKKVIPPVGLYEHKFNEKDGKSAAATIDPDDHGVAQELNDQLQNLKAHVDNTTSPNQVVKRGEQVKARSVDMKFVARPVKKRAATQAFSCFADTQEVDFSRGQTRDEVSFYKKLARTDQAKKLGIELKDYEDLIRKHKSGKYIINFVKVTNQPSDKFATAKPSSNNTRQATEVDEQQIGQTISETIS